MELAQEVLRVRIAEYQVARAPVLLKIFGVGSCVALAFYDPVLKLGGLAHILLPGPAPMGERGGQGAEGSPSKYADQGTQALLRAMLQKGGARERLTAAIVGGSNMFLGTEEWGDSFPLRRGIGERNIQAVREQLERLRIPLRGEDVGGKIGRTVALDTESGRIIVTTTRGESRII